MPRIPLPLTLQLADGESLRWTQRCAARVHVVSGRVWLTRTGDAADHFLHAGDSCRLQSERGVLLGAEGPVCLRLEPLRRARLPHWTALRRWWGNRDPDGIIFR